MIWKIWKISVLVIITPKDTSSSSAAATLYTCTICIYYHCLAFSLVICPFYFHIIFNNGFHLWCFRLCCVVLQGWYSYFSKSQMNEMVKLIPTCIFSSKKKTINYTQRYLLLLRRRHPLYMYNLYIHCFSELRRIILE
jgi:hypothetical protein